jgi:hypothetical protein
MNEEEITFGDNKDLAKALMKWINTSVQKANDESEESWKKTVDEYIEKLTRQKAERTKLIPEIAKSVFQYANSNESAKACMSTTDYAALAPELKALLIAGGYVADAAEAAEYLGETTGPKTTKVSDWYKVKGGLFNDGEDYKK